MVLCSFFPGVLGKALRMEVYARVGHHFRSRKLFHGHKALARFLVVKTSHLCVYVFIFVCVWRSIKYL